jgi:hypothetical protein
MDRPTKYNPVPVERKELILTDAKELIIQGWTLQQIADKHEVDRKTLNTWLLSLGDEYQALRNAWIDSKLTEAAEAIESADEQFPLARAREMWKAATWYAERRDSQRYGQKTEHKQDLSLSITVNRSLPEATVIQGDYVAITDELRNDPL